MTEVFQHVFLSTRTFLNRNSPSDLVKDMISYVFPDEEGFEFVNVSGDGKCLVYSLRQGLNEHSSEREFIEGCRMYFQKVPETYYQHNTTEFIHLHNGLSDEALRRIWHRILLEANDLPSNMIAIMQYMFKCQIVCMQYDARSSDRQFSVTIYNDYDPPVHYIEGHCVTDELKTVIIFNHGGHYWLIDNRNIQHKLNKVAELVAGVTPFVVVE